MILLLYYKKQIARIIKKFENFWDLSLVGSDSQESQEIQARLKLYKRAIYTFISLSSLQILAFVLTPILSPGRNLPYRLWLPNNSASPFYEIVFLLEVYALFQLISMVIGADALFIAFCGSLGVQFRLLAYKLKNSKNGEGLRASIIYHKYLLL